MDALDTVKTNQFDLLSAYIDNEVSLAERKQVESWLRSDPDCLLLYQQLLQVQRSCQVIPTPAPSMPVEQTIEQVMARIDSRRRLPLWGALGAAAILVGGVAGLVTGSFRTPQIIVEGSKVPESINVRIEPIQTDNILVSASDLQIDIDKPLTPITADTQDR